MCERNQDSRHYVSNWRRDPTGRDDELVLARVQLRSVERVSKWYSDREKSLVGDGYDDAGVILDDDSDSLNGYAEEETRALKNYTAKGVSHVVRARPSSASMHRSYVTEMARRPMSASRVRTRSAQTMRLSGKSLSPTKKNHDFAWVPRQIENSKWTEMLKTGPRFRDQMLQKLEKETFNLLSDVLGPRTRTGKYTATNVLNAEKHSVKSTKLKDALTKKSDARLSKEVAKKQMDTVGTDGRISLAVGSALHAARNHSIANSKRTPNSSQFVHSHGQFRQSVKVKNERTRRPHSSSSKHSVHRDSRLTQRELERRCAEAEAQTELLQQMGWLAEFGIRKSQAPKNQSATKGFRKRTKQKPTLSLSNNDALASTSDMTSQVQGEPEQSTTHQCVMSGQEKSLHVGILELHDTFLKPRGDSTMTDPSPPNENKGSCSSTLPLEEPSVCTDGDAMAQAVTVDSDSSSAVVFEVARELSPSCHDSLDQYAVEDNQCQPSGEEEMKEVFCEAIALQTVVERLSEASTTQPTTVYLHNAVQAISDPVDCETQASCSMSSGFEAPPFVCHTEANKKAASFDDEAASIIQRRFRLHRRVQESRAIDRLLSEEETNSSSAALHSDTQIHGEELGYATRDDRHVEVEVASEDLVSVMNRPLHSHGGEGVNRDVDATGILFGAQVVEVRNSAYILEGALPRSRSELTLQSSSLSDASKVRGDQCTPIIPDMPPIALHPEWEECSPASTQLESTPHHAVRDVSTLLAHAFGDEPEYGHLDVLKHATVYNGGLSEVSTYSDLHERAAICVQRQYRRFVERRNLLDQLKFVVQQHRRESRKKTRRLSSNTPPPFISTTRQPDDSNAVARTTPREKTSAAGGIPVAANDVYEGTSQATSDKRAHDSKTVSVYEDHDATGVDLYGASRRSTLETTKVSTTISTEPERLDRNPHHFRAVDAKCIGSVDRVDVSRVSSASSTMSVEESIPVIMKQESVDDFSDGPWERYMDTATLKSFYYHPVRNVSRWDRPPDEHVVDRIDASGAIMQDTSSMSSSHDQANEASQWQDDQVQWNMRRAHSVRGDKHGEWQAFEDEETHQTFYYNSQTGACTWEKPASFPHTRSEWVMYMDPATSQPYYVNVETSETTWERPADFHGTEDADGGLLYCNSLMTAHEGEEQDEYVISISDERMLDL